MYLGDDNMNQDMLNAYLFSKNLTNNLLKKKFVLSPYPCASRACYVSKFDAHLKNFKKLAGYCDIIAIQEGRGCGNMCYFEPF